MSACRRNRFGRVYFALREWARQAKTSPIATKAISVQRTPCSEIRIAVHYMIRVSVLAVVCLLLTSVSGRCNFFTNWPCYPSGYVATGTRTCIHPNGCWCTDGTEWLPNESANQHGVMYRGWIYGFPNDCRLGIFFDDEGNWNIDGTEYWNGGGME